MGIIWIVAIGFAAGVIAKFVMPGFSQSSGYNLTATLGILGAVVASFIGLFLGWFAPGQGGGMVAAALGAMAALAGWDRAQKRA